MSALHLTAAFLGAAALASGLLSCAALERRTGCQSRRVRTRLAHEALRQGVASLVLTVGACALALA